jgi:GNAT superfamily N-acetyltransferase
MAIANLRAMFPLDLYALVPIPKGVCVLPTQSKTDNLVHELDELRAVTTIDPKKIAQFPCILWDICVVFFQTPQGVTLYAFDGDDQVGNLMFEPYLDCYCIKLLEVDQKWRNRGIGSALLLSAYATIRQYARNQDVENVTITWLVHPLGCEDCDGSAQKKLIKFYQDHGARCTSDSSHMSIKFSTRSPI